MRATLVSCRLAEITNSLLMCPSLRGHSGPLGPGPKERRFRGGFRWIARGRLGRDGVVPHTSRFRLLKPLAEEPALREANRSANSGASQSPRTNSKNFGYRNPFYA